MNIVTQNCFLYDVKDRHQLVGFFDLFLDQKLKIHKQPEIRNVDNWIFFTKNMGKVSRGNFDIFCYNQTIHNFTENKPNVDFDWVKQKFPS